MILHKQGITIELTNPADIRHHLSLGYVDVAPVDEPDEPAPFVRVITPPAPVIEEPPVEALESDVLALDPEPAPEVEAVEDTPAKKEKAVKK